MWHQDLEQLPVERVPDVEVVLGLLRRAADDVVAVRTEGALAPAQVVHHVAELLQAGARRRLEEPHDAVVGVDDKLLAGAVEGDRADAGAASHAHRLLEHRLRAHRRLEDHDVALAVADVDAGAVLAEGAGGVAVSCLLFARGLLRRRRPLLPRPRRCRRRQRAGQRQPLHPALLHLAVGHRRVLRRKVQQRRVLAHHACERQVAVRRVQLREGDRRVELVLAHDHAGLDIPQDQQPVAGAGEQPPPVPRPAQRGERAAVAREVRRDAARHEVHHRHDAGRAADRQQRAAPVERRDRGGQVLQDVLDHLGELVRLERVEERDVHRAPPVRPCVTPAASLSAPSPCPSARLKGTSRREAPVSADSLTSCAARYSSHGSAPSAATVADGSATSLNDDDVRGGR